MDTQECLWGVPQWSKKSPWTESQAPKLCAQVGMEPHGRTPVSHVQGHGLVPSPTNKILDSTLWTTTYLALENATIFFFHLHYPLLGCDDINQIISNFFFSLFSLYFSRCRNPFILQGELDQDLENLVSFPSPALADCVTLGKLFNLSIS